MTRTEIILKMHGGLPQTMFRTKGLGGDVGQLESMRNEGLISRKRVGGHDWFLSDEQHMALSFLFAEQGA